MAEPKRAWRNTYWLLRHGRSAANEQDLIVSRLHHGTLPQWGLTAEGREQAAAAGQRLRTLLGAATGSGAGEAGSAQPSSEDGAPDGHAGGQNGDAPSPAAAAFNPAALLLLTSPFSRTVETALAAGAALGVRQGDPRLQLEPALRERNFGDYEMTSCANYEKVWAEDAKSTANRPPGEGGESVQDVAARTLGLLERLEAQHVGRHIVLVSHGDALSILAAAALSSPLGAHRAHGLPNCGILRIG